MGRLRNLLIGLALVTGLISCINAQAGSRPALVPHPEVLARIGYSANFTCESHRIPLSHCLWQRRSDTPQLISFSQESGRPGAPSKYPGYAYLGDGLDRGSCGIVISIVKDEDRAQWECTLLPTDGIPFTGMVDVKILKKPNIPQLLDVYDRLTKLVDPEISRAEQGVVLTCFAEGGQPQPQFKWFIGDEEIPNHSPYVETIYNGQNYTGQNLTHFTFTREHNGLFVRCVLIHETISEYEMADYTVTRQVVIQYPPRSYNRYTPVLVDGVGERAIIAVNVSANPPPEVLWFVGSEPPVKPTETRPRFQAHSPIAILNHSGLYEYRLEIFKLEEEDLGNTYRLRADNRLGNPIELEIKLTTSVPESGGLSAGGIVGLVLGIPALLIIIAVIVVYTRAKGLLCFKGNDGTASEKERMDGGESAAGGEEQQQQPKPQEEKKEKEVESVVRRVTSRLSAIYENVKPKKKDKTAPIDEEAAKEKQEKEKESVPAGENAPTEGTEGKKPDDIVYAELDLTLDKSKPPTVVVRSDDKTEYAEIVGVVPQGDAGGDSAAPKDKSPAGGSPAGGSPKK